MWNIPVFLCRLLLPVLPHRHGYQSSPRRCRELLVWGRPWCCWRGGRWVIDAPSILLTGWAPADLKSARRSPASIIAHGGDWRVSLTPTPTHRRQNLARIRGDKPPGGNADEAWEGGEEGEGIRMGSRTPRRERLHSHNLMSSPHHPTLTHGQTDGRTDR